MKPRRIAVIGGGISGLAFANRIREAAKADSAPFEISIVEAQDRLGGIIESFRDENFLFEGGPESFITEKPWALELCQRLGLGSQLINTRAEYRRSFIVRKGRLEAVPEGFYLIAPSRILPFLKSGIMSWRGKMRVLAEPFLPARKNSGDESAASFIRRRFGAEALRWAGQPMLGGIYSADPERLSLRATFPKFLDWERDHGSIIRALRARSRAGKNSESLASGPRYGLFASLRMGMESLIRALLAHNPDLSVTTGAAAVRLSRTSEGWTILLGSGQELRADAVACALPGPRAARLLAPEFPELAAQIASIPCSSSVTVNLGYREFPLASKFRGFGFVVPEEEGSGILGCTFSHLKFEGRAPSDQALLRVFLRGKLRDRALAEKDEKVVTEVLLELERLLGISARPVLSAVRRYPDSMPQYEVGHLDKAAAILKRSNEIPGLYLLGNTYCGVGLPDCIRLAESKAIEAMEFLS